MVAWDTGATLADRFRAHAGDADHLYGHAMRAMAADWEAGGPVRQVCAGYEDAPTGSAIQLRLLAAVFRLVLTGGAPELAPYYPCLGGQDAPEGVWPVLRRVIAVHVDEIRGALEIAPQTNEVGRSAALLAGLFDLVAASDVRRIRVLELGASAGLNLLVDQFGFRGDGWNWGPADSPVQLAKAIEGPVRPEAFDIVERRGCDLSPVEASTADGRLLLTSFVWPFHLHRHERLAGALQIAQQIAPHHRITVDAAGASDWLPGQLDQTYPDVLTVVWHSITQLYWSVAEIEAVAGLLGEAGDRQPLGRVAMEYQPGSGPDAVPELRTTLWRPGQAPRERRLGSVHHHGIPVRLS